MILLILAIFFVVAIILWSISTCRRPENFPPGPGFLPIIGNLIYYQKRHTALGFHHMVWQELAQKYGPVVGLKLGFGLVVAISGHEAVKEVLSREEFDGRPNGYLFKLRTFGKTLGLVFTDGPFWKTQRKFSVQHLKNFGFGRKGMEERIEEECKKFIEKLEKKGDEPMFMHDAFNVSVLNALWTMLAGERFELDDKRLEMLLEIIHGNFRAVDMSGGLINQLPFLRHIPPCTSTHDIIVDVSSRMWAFLQGIIDDHKSNITSDPRDLIDAFLNAMAIEADESFTDKQLMALCLDLFMAGTETTSNSLGFATMYTVLYPDIQKKVQEELDQVVGRNRLPTLKDKINLKYTQAVLLEVQRRCNLAPMGIAHRATKDTELMGYNIEKGTLVLPNLYSVHMDEKVWENPEEFRPERFLDQNGNVVAGEGTYFPFGLGKRRCMGEAMGKTSLFLFFTSILHNFVLEPVNGFYPDLLPYDGATLAPKPFKVKLTPRM